MIFHFFAQKSIYIRSRRFWEFHLEFCKTYLTCPCRALHECFPLEVWDLLKDPNIQKERNTRISGQNMNLINRTHSFVKGSAGAHSTQRVHNFDVLSLKNGVAVGIWRDFMTWQGRDKEYPLASLPIKLVLGDYSLLLSLRRPIRETAWLIPPEPWWHLRMWDSRPSQFMIIPNTRSHPNNTKTD